MEQWQKKLGAQPYSEIQMIPSIDQATQQPTDALNSVDAIPKIENALKVLNVIPQGGHLRIVCLGTAFSAFLYEAVTYLLKEWKDPVETVAPVKTYTSLHQAPRQRMSCATFASGYALQ